MSNCRYTSGYREYYHQEEWFPSVTSVLSVLPKPYISQWKRKYSPEQIEAVLKYSSTRGTLIHYNALQQYCNAFITQNPPDMRDVQKALENNSMGQEIQLAMSHFKEFRSVFTLEPIAVERVVHNHKVGYAGRVDFQGHFLTGGKKIPILMDIKTGQEVYKDDAALQLTAYNKALNDFADRLYILLLHPGPTTIEGVPFGGKYAYWSFIRVYPDWEEFMKTLELFHKIKGNKRYIDYSEWITYF